MRRRSWPGSMRLSRLSGARSQKGDKADPNRLTELRQGFKESQQEAQKFLVHDEFEETLKREGGTNLNAGTSSDYTVYFVNLP